MPFLFPSGQPSGAGTSQQPGMSTAQIYQPANQPGLDQAYQSLISQLYNPALGGLQALPGGGNISPAQQLAPNAMNIGLTQSGPSGTPGAYGPYGNMAVGGALNASNLYSGLFGTSFDPLSAANNNLYNASYSAPSLLYNSVNNPQISQLVQSIINNPYNPQALAGATSAAGIGNLATGNLPLNIANLQGLGGNAWSDAEQRYASMLQQVPELQGLATGLGKASGDLPPEILALNPQLQSIYNQLVPGMASAAGPLANRAINNSSGLLNTIAGAGRNLMAEAPGFANQALSLNAPLAGAERSILGTGFDPQSGLYNRTASQLLDQQRAINAASGVGTSPYGAGVTGNTMENFNIDWQNQQLQRQATAANVAQGLSGQQLSNITGAGNLVSGLTGVGANLGLGVAGQRLSNLTGGANIYSNLGGTAGNLATGLTQPQAANIAAAGGLQNTLATGAGNLATGAAGLNAGALSSLLQGYGTGANLYGQELGLAGQGAGLTAGLAGLPASIYGQQQGQGLGALGTELGLQTQGLGGLGAISNITGQAAQQQQGVTNALAQGGALPAQISNYLASSGLGNLTNALNIGQSQFQLPQQLMNDIQSYLQIGQAASNISGQLGALGFNQNQANLGNIGTLAGLSSGALFGQPGLGLTGGTGILGSGTSGLLGAGGLGAGLASLFGGGLTAGEAGAASGFGGAFGSGALDLGLLFA